jgi:two-component system, OmpR family, sensor histidine kinase BaeS
MRLRLFHQLFLLVAGTVLFTAMAMAFILSFSLRNGFSEYLEAQDVQQLEEFAKAAANNIFANEPSKFKADGSVDINALITDMIRSGDVPNAPQSVNGSNAAGNIDASSRALSPVSLRPRRGRTPPGGFAKRLMMFDAAGIQVTGPPPPQGMTGAKVLEQEIVFDGNIVAFAKLLPRRRVPGNVDANFLKSQYQNSALVILLLLFLAAVPAFLIARLGVKRLADLRHTANEIAQGNLTARVAVRGDDELSAMGLHINSMAESLSSLDNSRRRWLAEISHELRTPLSVLVGELDALKDGVRPVNLIAIESLSDETQRMRRIVDDLHQLAVAEMQGSLCEFETCDAVKIIRRLSSRFESAFQKAGLDLSVNCKGQSEMPVVWDSERIGQMLANILTNSLRYTTAPGRTVISVTSTPSAVSIQIDDSAPTVSSENMVRLSQPLFRVEESRDRTSGGSGLGLCVSEAIVNSHRGSISVAKSELGGLCVTVILPQDARKR